ncbi:cobalamin biosynthesis protein [Acidianus sp. RZ1]|uniref:cobalamin biosynthesis protein n=1 Tax=Acidianus sp. RZ1 TaxID=1540082 RepID=UPI001490F2AC|nr:cobalamin biosynthesis protein [Acidianus sp. RZ1]NON63236.1 cobalt-precorrin 5A hydrolase [Acidianus sp. RZ1]
MIERFWRGVLILSVSEEGWKTAEDIREKIEKEFEVPVIHSSYNPKILENYWDCIDLVIFIMALEGSIRISCRFAKSKDKDPAVISIDDRSKFVIPILGGHWGSNDAAEDISRLIGSPAVITTASELQGIPSVERIASFIIAKVENPQELAKVNGAIVRGEKVCLNGIDLNLGDHFIKGDDCKYVISIGKAKGEHVIFLRPLNVAVGIGSKREVNVEGVWKELSARVKEMNIQDRVKVIGSVREEFKEIAHKLKAEFKVFSLEELKGFSSPCITPSGEKLKSLGVPGVSEAIALTLGGKSSRLILRKVKVGNYATLSFATIEGD